MTKALVQIYLGLGTQRVLIWTGVPEYLPRVGEYVTVDDNSHEVERVNHNLPHRVGQNRVVEIYAR